MRKHVVQFEIDVPGKATTQEVINNLKALLDLLNYKASKLELDPPPEIKIVPDSHPYPYDYPKRPEKDEYPWKRTDPYWKYFGKEKEYMANKPADLDFRNL